MRALVVYESMYGNTHVVASNVADGLRATHEVTLVPVAEATADLVAGADLLVVGGPTHMHGLSSPATRRMAAQAAAKPASGLSLDPDACGPGLRDWLKGIGAGNRHCARPGGRLRHPAQRRPGVHRPRQPGHRQAAEAARLPSHRRPGELPGRPAEHAARRRGVPGPPLGCRARRHRHQHPPPGTGLSGPANIGTKDPSGAGSHSTRSAPWGPLSRSALAGDALEVPCADGNQRRYLSFDAAAATGALPSVLDAVQAFVPWYASAQGAAGYKSQASAIGYECARLAALAFAGRGPASDDVVVFCPNATEAIRHLADRLRLSRDDVVITTVAEHHANVLPWSRAAHCRYVECGRTGPSTPRMSSPH